MSDKLFTLAGTSDLNGVTTYRFATGNAKVREAILRRADHTNIKLMETPSPMTKEQAIAWLAEQGIAAVKPRTGRQKSEAPAQAAAAVAAGVAELESAVTLTTEDVEFLSTQESVED